MTFADALLETLPEVAILYAAALLLWLATLRPFARFRAQARKAGR